MVTLSQRDSADDTAVKWLISSYCTQNAYNNSNISFGSELCGLCRHLLRLFIDSDYILYADRSKGEMLCVVLVQR